MFALLFLLHLPVAYCHSGMELPIAICPTTDRLARASQALGLPCGTHEGFCPCAGQEGGCRCGPPCFCARKPRTVELPPIRNPARIPREVWSTPVLYQPAFQPYQGHGSLQPAFQPAFQPFPSYGGQPFGGSFSRCGPGGCR